MKGKGLENKNLGRYVDQVMKAEGVSAPDVAARCGNKITAAYVSEIRNGTAANPSVDKIKALATGLGVDPHELFDIACGPIEINADPPRGNERLQVLELLDLMKKVVTKPHLMSVAEKAAHLPAKELDALLAAANRFSKAARKTRGKHKRS